MSKYSLFISYKHGDHFGVIGSMADINSRLTDIVNMELGEMDNNDPLFTTVLVPAFYDLVLSGRNEPLNVSTITDDFITVQKVASEKPEFLIHVNDFNHSCGRNIVGSRDEVIEEFLCLHDNREDVENCLNSANDDGYYFEIPNPSLWVSVFPIDE